MIIKLIRKTSSDIAARLTSGLYVAGVMSGIVLMMLLDAIALQLMQ